MSINMPVPTAVGQQYKASNDVTYVWDGQKWISIGSTDTDTNNTTVGDSAPQNPGDGDLWYDTENGILYVYYEDESIWVDCRPAAAGPQSSGN